MEYPVQEYWMMPYNQLPSADALAALPRQKQKRILGSFLFPLVHTFHPHFADKITDIILDINNIDELLRMISEVALFRIKVEQAVTVLKLHYAQQAANIGN